jgi:hypothetical protein
MNENQINEMRVRLAKELGFQSEHAKIDKPCKIWIYITGPDTHVDWIEVANWRPDEDIRQAHQVLAMFDNYCIEHYWKDYEVSITNKDAIQFKSGDCETIPQAICIAACRAIGMKI